MLNTPHATAHHRPFLVRGFPAAMLLILTGLGMSFAPARAGDGYPADFDPRFDLPSPPPWSETANFIPTTEHLLDLIRDQGRVRVRVDPRLPRVNSAQLNDEQHALWTADVAELRQTILDSLPVGSYQLLTPADTAPATPSGSLLLIVDRVALEVLMTSAWVANLQASPALPLLSSGTGHSAWLAANGVVWTWGFNASGQLGDGTLRTRVVPTPILEQATAVAVGAGHSLALTSDGTLWAWGANGDGQVGDGTTARRLKPVRVLTEVSAMAAGGEHSLALTADGTLWAWGANEAGQVGDGTTYKRVAPRQVLSGVTQVAAGDTHSLALKADGTLWAWGGNGTGQLGDGSTAKRVRPRQVLSGVIAMAAGGYHSLALKSDGSLWAWGAGGQVGDGTRLRRLWPKQILTGVTALAAGGYHSHALTANGSLWAWGYNAAGQLGDGTLTPALRPKQVLAGVTQVAAGDAHSLALKADGSLWAWGANAFGQLGNGTLSKPRPQPVRVKTNTLTVTAQPTPATEAGTPGRFTFRRAGDPSAALTVTFAVSGSATAGRDYAAIGNTVTFTAGTEEITKSIKPIQDTLVEGDETVVLTLTDGAGYALTSARQGQVTLRDDDR